MAELVGNKEEDNMEEEEVAELLVGYKEAVELIVGYKEQDVVQIASAADSYFVEPS